MDRNRYTSDYFAFTYLFPERLEVVEDLMEGEEDATQQAFVLLAVYTPSASGENQQGVVIFADRLEQTGGNAGSASQYFANLAGILGKNGTQLVVAKREYVFAGKKFFRADLERAGEGEGFHAILITLDRGYALGFQFVASTEKEIDSLIDSLNTLKFTPAKNPGLKTP